ncbi:MAG: DsbA family protein [Anaerolineales bacterium]
MTPAIEITYFTDPYCSWCWATEPMLYRLRETYREQIMMRYVMGGLVRDMSDFYDSLNAIRTTAEVAPHWRMVSERSGQPIDERLMNDITDPHFSTWPACSAVKAAQLQGEAIGEAYLRRMRRAALTERQIVSAPDVFNTLAHEAPGLDFERLQVDLTDGSAQRAFEEDLAECRQYGVSGFPTLLFRLEEKGVIVHGHRTFETYQRAMEQVLGGEQLVEFPPRDALTLLGDYGPLTTRELAEVYAQPTAALRAEMKKLEAEGQAGRLPVHGGEFWTLPGPIKENPR